MLVRENPVDNALHTLFQCDAWHHSSTGLENAIGEEVDPDNIVATTLRSNDNWTAIREFFKTKNFFFKKEDEERRRQALQIY